MKNSDRDRKFVDDQTSDNWPERDSEILGVEYEEFVDSLNYGDSMFDMVMLYANETQGLDIRGVSMILFRQTAIHLLTAGMTVDGLKQIISQATMAIERSDSNVESTQTLH